MRNDALSIQSMEFAVSVIRLVKCLKEQQDNYFKSDRQSGISIGANIREAQYEHGKSDFIAKLQIALKEASGTDYWFELLLETEYIDAETYQALERKCKSLRLMLISSLNTAKGNNDKLR